MYVFWFFWKDVYYSFASFFKPRYCNSLELQQGNLVKKTAIYIADHANEYCDIQGRQPNSVAAAAIYLACLVLCENQNKKSNFLKFIHIY